MTERGYMNQENSKKQIKVKLYKDNGIDLLEFSVSASKKHKLNINLEDNQSDIKSMFCDLVEMLEESSIELELDVIEGYDNKLLEEVSVEYVKDLNKELENVRAEILDKYPDSVSV